MPLRDNPACDLLLAVDAVERTVIPPWFERTLVSWWDMEQFSARKFYQMGRLLNKVAEEHRAYKPDIVTEVMLPELSAHLSEQRVAGLQDFMKEVSTHCSELGLDVSQQHAEYISDNAKTLTNAQVADRLEHLDETIRFEMGKHLFFFVLPETAEFYRQKQPLFGKDVNDAFPSAIFDVQEAGKCLALTRSTACGFHLMRVLEIGLGVLGKVFGVSLAHTNWAPALDEIESKIREMHKDPVWKAMPDCKEQQEFYAQAASHFGVLKDAWRNYTMHTRGKYTEDEAKQIFGSVRAFMQKLATRLHE